MRVESSSITNVGPLDPSISERKLTEQAPSSNIADLSDVAAIAYEDMEAYVTDRRLKLKDDYHNTLLGMREEFSAFMARLSDEVPELANADWSLHLNRDGSFRVESTSLNKLEVETLTKALNNQQGFRQLVSDVPSILSKLTDVKGIHQHSNVFEESRLFERVDFRQVLEAEPKARSSKLLGEIREIVPTSLDDSTYNLVSGMSRNLWEQMGQVERYYGGGMIRTDLDEIAQAVGRTVNTWI